MPRGLPKPADGLWGVDLETVADEWSQPVPKVEKTSSWLRFAFTVGFLVLSCLAIAVFFQDYLGDVLKWFEQYVIPQQPSAHNRHRPCG
jgi:hypothetical protein